MIKNSSSLSSSSKTKTKKTKNWGEGGEEREVGWRTSSGALPSVKPLGKKSTTVQKAFKN